MDLFLKDKRVLITGGSKGLGLACAQAFLKEGAQVAIVSRNPDNLQAAAAILTREGRRVTSVAGDLSVPEEAARVVDEVEHTLGPIDILINSAGDARRRAPEELDAAAWKAGMDAKFFPYIYMQDVVLRRLTERAKAAGLGDGPPDRQIGAIVNIVGIGGRFPNESHLAGGAANAALLLSTIGLAQYYARYGIRINAINPSLTLTDRIEQAVTLEARRRGIDREEAFATGARNAPLRRYGRADEIADVALFLASERASYVVGALLSVDGGQKSIV